MTWFRTFGLFEWMVVAVFLAAYAAYLFRMLRVARQLHTSVFALIVKLLLRTGYFTLFLIALLGPSFGKTLREVESVGKDIYLAVDLSSSMNATDIQPTRLEKIKFELKNIVDAFSSDRLGIIIFSNEAFVQCPLTFDQSALYLWIESLNTSLVPDAGTNFGPPLEMALDKLSGEESQVQEQKSKIIVLVSDGEDFGENTEVALEEIEQAGIKLFTLGVGTEQGSRIPTRNGYLVNENGEPVVSKLTPAALQNMAEETGGEYFEVSGRINEVNRLINSLNSIRGESRETRQLEASSNRYTYFLLAGLVLLLIDVLLPIRIFRLT